MKRACGLLILLLCFAASAGAAERRPNFLVILGDNLGKDWFGCYGADGGHTPNIDRLAKGGVRFEHCYVTPLCSTTRAALLAGRYGFRTGWHTHHDAAIYGGGGFDWRRETTWAKALQSAGYATAITGKWQINDLLVDTDALARHGFGEHLVWTGSLVGEGNAEQRWRAHLATGHKQYELESRYWDPVVFRNGERQTLTGQFGPDVFADALIDFMARQRDERKSFVAFYSCPLTHIPTVPTPLTPDKSAPERELFAGMVRYFDTQVGRFEQALEKLGLRDDTILIVLTDNGTARRVSGSVGGQPAVGGLGTLSENGLDVPLIVNCPRRVPAGQVSETLVDGTDLFPTLLDLADVPLPNDIVLDGRSFAPQLGRDGLARAPRDWIFAQYSTTRVVRDRRFKLYSTGELFDVSADPLEKKNLAENTDAETVAARDRLRKVLAQLPPEDVQLPFEYRSSSAFQIKAKRAK